MRGVVLYALVSLDGVAGSPDTDVFTFDETMDANLAEVVGSQDALLLGCGAGSKARPSRQDAGSCIGRGAEPGDRDGGAARTADRADARPGAFSRRPPSGAGGTGAVAAVREWRDEQRAMPPQGDEIVVRAPVALLRRGKAVRPRADGDRVRAKVETFLAAGTYVALSAGGRTFRT